MTHGGNVWQGGAPESWLDFSANLRPEGPPDWVIRALEDAISRARYYPDVSLRRAKGALAAWLGISEETVLPTSGGIAALALAFASDAPEVLLPTPCFGEYEALAVRAGKRVQKVSIMDYNVSPAEALKPYIRENALVCLGNPVNPLGRAFCKEEMLALLEIVERKRGYLLIDEAFVAYCPEHSLVQEVASHPRLLIAQSLTKLLCVPGVRLGCLCAEISLLRRLQSHQLTWEMNCFAEAVVCALPQHADETRREAEISAARRRRLADGLEALGAFVYPSSAPFVLARFDRPVGKFAVFLRERRILVRECLDFDGLSDGRHLRLAVKDDNSNEILLRTLKEALACAENH